LQDQEISDILKNDDDEVLDGDSDSDEEDQVEERKEDSGSEESALSSDDEDDITLSQRIDLLGRRKNYKWHLKEPMQSVRTRRCKIAVHLPGTRQPFTNRRTPTDTFLCFFTETMLDEIVKCSNLEIARVRENFKRDRDATDTNIVEMKAAIGFLLMAGVIKSSHCNTDELWGKHEINAETGEKKKPEIICFYNQTKAGVDMVDQMSSNYSVARKTNRWPLFSFIC